MTRRIALLAALVVGGLLAGARPAPAAEPSVGQALQDLPKYKFGESREHLTLLSNAVRDAKGADRARLLDRLAAVLASNATPDAKRWVCRELSVFGTEKEVPPLAALLVDEELSDIARYALERIPAEAALKAMRDALPKAKPAQKIGIVNSLGERQDKAAVAALIALLKGTDVPIAVAAAGALGKIGGPDAVKALAEARPGAADKLRPVVADAYLKCADRLVAEKKNDEAAAIYQEMFKPTEPKHLRVAALRGIVAAGGEKTLPLLTEILTGTDAEMQAAALRFLREVAGPETTKALVGLLPKLPASAQAMLLEDLAMRGDPSALPAVLEAVKSQDEAVKGAAVKALGTLGDASALGVLVPLAGSGGPLADAARRSLDSLPGADVNAALLGLASKGEPAARKEVLRSLGARRADKAMPVLLAAAGDADAGIRQEALKALEAMADEKSAPALVGLVTKATDDADRAAAEKALAALCGRAENKDACAGAVVAALASAPVPAKCALLRTLPRAGGAKALVAVTGATGDAQAEVQDAAVRALADWPDAAAAGSLLKIAKSAEKPAHQVLALRGYIRLAGASTGPVAEKLKMYQEAMAAAKRPDEKKQVLGGLGQVKAVEALQMVIPALGDATLQNEAAVAAVAIAKNLGAQGKDVIRQAMQKVLEVSKDQNLRKEADGLLKKAGGAK